MYGLKNSVAKKLGIDPDKVHVVSPFVGGAFGSKAQLTPRSGLVAFAAKKLNRPVKLVATRDQGFTIATYRAETQHPSASARSEAARSRASSTKAPRSPRGPIPTRLPASKTARGSMASAR